MARYKDVCRGFVISKTSFSEFVDKQSIRYIVVSSLRIKRARFHDSSSVILYMYSV